MAITVIPGAVYLAPGADIQIECTYRNLDHGTRLLGTTTPAIGSVVRWGRGGVYRRQSLGDNTLLYEQGGVECFGGAALVQMVWGHI